MKYWRWLEYSWRNSKIRRQATLINNEADCPGISFFGLLLKNGIMTFPSGAFNVLNRHDWHPIAKAKKVLYEQDRGKV